MMKKFGTNPKFAFLQAGHPQHGFYHVQLAANGLVLESDEEEEEEGMERDDRDDGGGAKASGHTHPARGRGSQARQAAPVPLPALAPQVVTQMHAKLRAKLLHSLYPFQREAVRFALAREGRMLLADEMGLGKTITAIAIATHYVDEWPMLIITPSSLRQNWNGELRRWVKEMLVVGRSNFRTLGGRVSVDVIESRKDVFNPESKVTIISYDMLGSFADVLQRASPQVVICDESHYLKSASALRTKLSLPLLRSAKRALLLTGTPVLSKPQELFTQLNAIAPASFPSLKDFALRYCQQVAPKEAAREDDQKQEQGEVQVEVGAEGEEVEGEKGETGVAPLTELHQRLKGFMIRRLKRSVLKLPAKHRRCLHVEAWEPDRLQAMRGLEKLSSEFEGEAVDAGNSGGAGSEGKGKKAEKLAHFMGLYRSSGLAKLPAVVRFVGQLLQRPRREKVLVFAHHSAVLDGVEASLNKQGSRYVRIDGGVVGSQRQELVDIFQTKPDVRVALLSITACGQGITLTAASQVVFAELYWNPGSLLQAEDRAHRIGQEKVTDIHYLLGRNTLDEVMWPMLSQKLEVLTETLSGEKGMQFEAERVPEPSAKAPQKRKKPQAGTKKHMPKKRAMSVFSKLGQKTAI